MRVWSRFLGVLILVATLGLPIRTGHATSSPTIDFVGASPAGPFLSLTLQLAIESALGGAAPGPSGPGGGSSGGGTPPSEEPDPPDDGEDLPDEGDELQPYDD
jgi:hypothetical protein